MICSHCNAELADNSAYCSSCGARQRSRLAHKQLMLSSKDAKIAGVCGGIAEYFDIDPTIVRLVWAALTIVPGGIVGGILAYILAWLIIPRAPAAVSSVTSASIDQPAKTT